jgi:DNA-binding MarR family transcriptional regulator
MTRQTRTRSRTDPQTAVRLRLVITRLARAVRQHGATGLTPSQLSALARIEDVGPLRISDLASRESVGAPVATRVVASLEELGYLERIEDATDRRACLIELTENGHDILKKLWGEGTAGLNSRIEKLNRTDIALLQAALPVLEILARDQSST